MPKIAYEILRNQQLRIIGSKKDSYEFKYEYIFNDFSTQQFVYLKVGRPIVIGALQGMNGTILTYGQTGSGKTYSLIGPN